MKPKDKHVCMATMSGVFTDLYFALYTNICCVLGNTDSLNNLSICTGLFSFYEARGGKVGRGTALEPGRLQVRYLMVSLEFLIEVLLRAALIKTSTRKISWG
jgi:hypothetical protein